MKKVLFLLLMLPTFAFSQFKLTPDGFRTNNNEEFYVVNFDSISAPEIYKRVKAQLYTSFKNPDIASNSIENELINLHGATDDIKIKSSRVGAIGKFNTTVDYNIIFKFKDGKLRIDAPILGEMYFINFQNKKDYVYVSGAPFGSISLFNKKGKVNNEDNVKTVETYFNKQINDVINAVKNDNNSNEW